MKLSLLFVAILGLATASAIPAGKLERSTKDLSDDWADFLALVDTEAIAAIALQYAADDAEVQGAIAWLQSDEAKALVADIDSIPEYIAFLDYLEDAGLNVRYYLNIIRGWIGVEPLNLAVQSRVGSTRITGGIAGFWADIKATLPMADLRALYDEKLQTSQAFADMIAKLKSAEAVKAYETLQANQTYQKIRAALVEYGLDIDHLIEVLKDLLGWE